MHVYVFSSLFLCFVNSLTPVFNLLSTKIYVYIYKTIYKCMMTFICIHMLI